MQEFVNAFTHSHWDEVEEHPLSDWKEEVANDDTRLGYLEWVNVRIEQQADE